jgi:hypothetical protein
MSEPRLHELTRRLVDRLAGQAQHLVDNAWRRGWCMAAAPRTLHLKRLMGLSRLFLTTRGATPATATALLDARLGHPHHHIGDTLGFLFVLITRFVHRELRLDRFGSSTT